MAGARPRLLVLDRVHRVLDGGDGGLELVLDAGPDAEAPMAAIEQALRARFGLVVPAPVGSRPAAPRAPRDFVFVLEGEPPTAPPGLRWRRLAEATTVGARADWLWDLYVDRVLAGWAPPRRDVDVFAFGAGVAMAGRLAHLVVAGCKRATAMWLDAARIDGSTVPAPGLVSVVVDGVGTPRAVIRTAATRVVRFGDVDAATAAAEGEGDLSLADWRAGHRAYFEREAATLGLTFTDDAELLIEHFEVLAVIGRAQPPEPR